MLFARLALSAAAVATLVGAGAPAVAGSSAGCGRPGYSYAGFASAEGGHGVRADLTALDEPSVANGHVAAWVGVGGPGEGPDGGDLWLQVGVSAVAGWDSSTLYYEVAVPGRAPRYAPLREVGAGETHRVAVLEMARRPGWWRVWVDGNPVTAPIDLQSAGRRWRPIATAETWDGGRRVCNRFDFAFDRVHLAGSRGGAWRPFARGRKLEDPGYRVFARSRSSFRAAPSA